MPARATGATRARSRPTTHREPSSYLTCLPELQVRIYGPVLQRAELGGNIPQGTGMERSVVPYRRDSKRLQSAADTSPTECQVTEGS
jgi:hypothetical protein